MKKLAICRIWDQFRGKTSASVADDKRNLPIIRLAFELYFIGFTGVAAMANGICYTL